MKCALIVYLLLTSPALAGGAMMDIQTTPFTTEEVRPDDMIVVFQSVVPGNDWPETVLTLRADGRIEYGPAWSPENFYRAVCASHRFGDCI